MSITTTARKAGPFAGNGVTTSFAFGFKVFTASDLLVVQTTAGGTDVTLALGTQYTVTLNADQDNAPGGSVAITAAPATGEKLTIVSNVPATQPVVLQNAGGFYPSVINAALDRVTILLQQLISTAQRAVTLPISYTASTELPNPTPGGVLGWNTAGDGLANVDLSVLATSIAYGGVVANTFTGNGASTSFTLSANPGSVNNLDVSVAGVVKIPTTDFTWDGTTGLTFVVAPANGAKVYVRFAQGLAQGTISDGAVSSAAKVADGVLPPAKLTTGAPSWDSSGNATISGTAQVAGETKTTGAAAALRGYSFRTSGTLRWFVAEDATAEGGSNAGSDLVFRRYSDAGSLLGTALTITRSTGAIATEAGLTVGGNLTLSGDGAFASATGPASALAVGFRGVPQNQQNSNYTLVLADAGRHIYSANTGAQTITVPTNASVAFPIGTTLAVFNNGTTAITISTTGITMYQAGTANTGNRTVAAKGLVTIMKVATDTWAISGAGLT